MIKTLSTLVLITLLTACAGNYRTPPTPADSPHQQQLLALKNWQVRGKFALRTQTESQSGNLHWHQQNDESILTLSGPLGMAATRIHSDGTQFTITRDGKSYTALTDDARVLGIALPLNALHYWLRGLPAPALPLREKILQNGLVQNLQQADWTLHFSRYQTSNAIYLPGKLQISHPQLTLKLILKNWQLPAIP